MINLSINFLNDSDRSFTTHTRKAMDWTAALGKAATAITVGVALAAAIIAPIPTSLILALSLAGSTY